MITRKILDKAITQAVSMLKTPEPSSRGSQPPEPPDDRSRLAQALLRGMAVRGWVNPIRLVPAQTPEALRGAVLNQLADAVETAFSSRPGEWFLGAGIRRRILADSEAWLDEALNGGDGKDAEDPYFTALRVLRGLEAPSLVERPLEEFQALSAVSGWLPRGRLPVWDVVHAEVGVRTAERRRDLEWRQLDGANIVGRDEAVSTVLRWMSNPPSGRQGVTSVLYLHGIGGSGKSTVLAVAERKARSMAVPPTIVHLDFDQPDINPGDPISLDLAFLRQLPVTDAERGRRRDGLFEELEKLRSDSIAQLRRTAGLATRRYMSIQSSKETMSSEALESTSDTIEFGRLSLLQGCLAESGSGLLPGGRPLVLLADTLEVLMVQGAVSIDDFLRWLTSLVEATGVRDLRLLVAGRDAPDPESSPADIVTRLCKNDLPRPELVSLPELAEGERLVVLKRLVGVGRERLAEAAAQALPGNPLVLRLAAEVLQRAADSTGALQDIYEAGRIDPETASLYIARRFIAHLPDPLTRRYGLAAFILPEIDVSVLRNIVMPVVDGRDDGQVSSITAARGVFEQFKRAAWLVIPNSTRSLVFHRELRRLLLRLIDADDKLHDLRDRIRARAIAWHRQRRRGKDRAFALYHQLMASPVWPDAGNIRNLHDHLRPFMDDLREEHRSILEFSGLTQRASSDRFASDLIEEHYKKQVKRGQVTEALDFHKSITFDSYRTPPNHILQALADSGQWDTLDPNVDLVLNEIDEAVRRGSRISGATLSRFYWITRLELLTKWKLTPRHQDLACHVLERVSPGVFPGLMAIAEAVCDRILAPPNWLNKEGSNESYTQFYLVRSRLAGETLTWQPHLDAMVVFHRGWPQNFRDFISDKPINPIKDNGNISHILKYMKDEFEFLWQPGLFPIKKYTALLSKCKVPVRVTMSPSMDPAVAAFLFRGQTIEIHRPLRNAILSAVKSSSIDEDAVLFAISETTRSMTVLPMEFNPPRVPSKIHSSNWLGQFINFTDRARLLPVLCKNLQACVNGSSLEAERLRRVAETFLTWDRAISGPAGSHPVPHA